MRPVQNADTLPRGLAHVLNAVIMSFHPRKLVLNVALT